MKSSTSDSNSSINSISSKGQRKRNMSANNIFKSMEKTSSTINVNESSQLLRDKVSASTETIVTRRQLSRPTFNLASTLGALSATRTDENPDDLTPTRSNINDNADLDDGDDDDAVCAGGRGKMSGRSMRFVKNNSIGNGFVLRTCRMCANKQFEAEIQRKDQPAFSILPSQLFNTVDFQRYCRETGVHLVTHFILENSPFEINIDGKVKDAVMKAIFETPVSCTPLVFAAALEQVIENMMQNCFPRFLNHLSHTKVQRWFGEDTSYAAVGDDDNDMM